MPRTQSAISRFILSLPATTAARDVVTQAKARGMVTSENNVYRVRRLFGGRRAPAAAARPAKPGPSAPVAGPKAPAASKAPAAPAKAPVRARPPAARKAPPRAKAPAPPLAPVAPAAAGPAAGSRPSTAAEELLRAVAAEIGLGRAVEILMGERARVHAVLRR